MSNMNCSKCGTFINQGEKFCRTCGTPVAVPGGMVDQGQMQQPMMGQAMQQPVQQPMVGQQPMVNEYGQPMQQPVNEYGQPVNNNYSQQSSVDEGLVNAFIGNNVQAIRAGGFSWCSFFFGMLYFLYRKMWMLSLVVFLLQFIANLFLPLFSFIISIVVNIVVAIYFKKWYVKHAEDKVAVIKHENNWASPEQLTAICTKKGGTTIVPVILILVVYVLLFALVFVLLGAIFAGAAAAGDSSYDGNDSTTMVEEIDDNSLGALSLTIPNEFVANEKNEKAYRVYNLNSATDNCKIVVDVAATSRYNSAPAYLEDNVFYSSSDSVTPLDLKTINNRDWSTMVVQKTYSTIYYYAIFHNNKIFDVRFEIKQDSGTCSTAHNEFINSLKLQ